MSEAARPVDVNARATCRLRGRKPDCHEPPIVVNWDIDLEPVAETVAIASVLVREPVPARVAFEEKLRRYVTGPVRCHPMTRASSSASPAA
jgi:hypothetical protein